MRRLSLVCMAALFAGPGVAAAQTVDLGALGGWGSDFDWMLGGRVTAGLPVENVDLEAVGEFEYFFPNEDNVDYWEINLNVNYLVPMQSQIIQSYVGAGLNIARISVDTPVGSGDETEIGLNVLGGLRGTTAKVKPFGELRFEIGGGEQFVFIAGVNFRVGGV